jgi:phosphoenolpyruvate phosphomutase
MRTSSLALRELLSRKKIATCAGAHNAAGARLAHTCGFEAIWSSSFEISASYCVPDASILSMTEYLQAARSICSTVPIPVIADCDTGYGNEANVGYAVTLFEAAGVSAISIEDQVFPKTNSLIRGAQQLVSIAEFEAKINAAKCAQTDPAFVVIARVEALIAGAGQQEALDRGHAYADAGADAILIHWNQRNLEPIATFLRQWKRKLPVIVVPTTYFDVSATELQQLGASMVIYANHGLRCALTAMEDGFKAILRDGTTARIEDALWPVSRVLQDLQGVHTSSSAKAPLSIATHVRGRIHSGKNGTHDGS